MRTEFRVTIGVGVWREIWEFNSVRSDGVLRHDYDRPLPKLENVLTYWTSTEWFCSKQQPVSLHVTVSSDVIYLHRSDTSHTSVGSDYRTGKKHCQCSKGDSTLHYSHTMAIRYMI